MADRIEETLREVDISPASLQSSVEKAGVPVIALVNQLRQAAGEAGPYVHRGATTQDIMDTARVLQLRSGLDILETRLRAVVSSLATLTRQHRHTLMAGRTHSQQALPITFGLKTAGWLAPLLRHRDRLKELRPRVLVLQLGGGSGTLSAWGDAGPSVQKKLADMLELNTPPLPWHTQRDGFAEVAGWFSLVTGSLAKMAQDIILMAQTEVGELRESADPSRGGSSTMPQKNNPVASEVIIACARANAALLPAMHQALIQEHERATHGWQLEWLTLPQMIVHTGAALNKAMFITQNLEVDTAQMYANVAASNGRLLAEAATFALAEHMDLAAAKLLVTAAVQTSLKDNLHLCDVLAAASPAPVDWQALKDEQHYLGATQAFIDNILALTEA